MPISNHKRPTILRWAPFAICLLALLLAAGRKPPEKAQSQLDFGVQMGERGLWSEALFRFKQAYRRDPSNAKVLNNLAVAYEALGRFDLALDFYQKAIRADSSNKEMKRNYSRFVEFYRSFRPDDQKVLDEAGPQAPPSAPAGQP